MELLCTCTQCVFLSQCASFAECSIIPCCSDPTAALTPVRQHRSTRSWWEWATPRPRHRAPHRDPKTHCTPSSVPRGDTALPALSGGMDLHQRRVNALCLHAARTRLVLLCPAARGAEEAEKKGSTRAAELRHEKLLRHHTKETFVYAVPSAANVVTENPANKTPPAAHVPDTPRLQALT